MDSPFCMKARIVAALAPSVVPEDERKALMSPTSPSTGGSNVKSDVLKKISTEQKMSDRLQRKKLLTQQHYQQYLHGHDKYTSQLAGQPRSGYTKLDIVPR